MENTVLMLTADFSVFSEEGIELLLDNISDSSVFDEIAKANINRPEILQLLLKHPDTPENVLNYIKAILNLPLNYPAAITISDKPHEAKTQSLLQRIQILRVGEKLQLALKGGREIRNILSKDPNKGVMLNVLENKKITETEIEMIARSRSVHEEALRIISKNREWLRNYMIVLALVTNPKTPPGIALTMVSDLKIKDLALLEKNKNIAEALRSAAKKMLQWKKPR